MSTRKNSRRGWIVAFAAAYSLLGFVALAFSQSDSGESLIKDGVRKYLEARTVEGRSRHVLDAARVRPLMEARYEGVPLPAYDAIDVGDPVKLDKPGGYYRVTATVRARGETVPLPYFAAVRGGVAGIDWEASIGHNKVPLATFLVAAPKEPTAFRVKAKLATYYNHDFRGGDDLYYSITLREDQPPSRVHGYILKGSADGKRLYQLLQDGKERPITLELQLTGPGGAPLQRPGNGVMTITRLLSDSWLR